METQPGCLQKQLNSPEFPQRNRITVKQMKPEKAFTIIGKKLEKEYKTLGFKYFKKHRFLRKRTKRFDYYIFFSLFFEHIFDTYTELRVTLIINDRTLLKKNIYANCEVFRMDLWEMGSNYNIANETLINDTFMDLRNKIEAYLLPPIKRLEGYTIAHNDVILVSNQQIQKNIIRAGLKICGK